jgi:hypothetical protein
MPLYLDPSYIFRWEMKMHRRQRIGARNKLDLNDRVQVRIVRKRLKVSDKQLASLVSTVGNSIAAVTKEVSFQRRLSLPNSQTRLTEVKETEVSLETLA